MSFFLTALRVRTRAVYPLLALLALGGALPMAVTGQRVLEMDAWLWLGLCVAAGGAWYVLTRQPEVHYRGIWLVLIGALVALAAQNYLEFRSTQDRLTQLHSDLSRRAADLLLLNQQNRLDAQTLARDLDDWSTTDDGERVVKEETVGTDLTVLQAGVRDADLRMQQLANDIRAKTTAPSQGVEDAEAAFRRSMLDPAVNLAQDAARATSGTVSALDLVQTTWDSQRSRVSDQVIIDSVNPGLWLAIDKVTSPVTRLDKTVRDATAVPVGDVVLVILVFNLALVLFPSLLVLLFIAGRRDVRLRQIYMDLWDLGGGTNQLLVRVLEKTKDGDLNDHGFEKDEVRRELQDRTFSDIEYLLCLLVLTFVLAGAWHLVIYPTGELGLVALFAEKVSVNDLITHVVANLNVLTLGFLGAYFFSVGVLIRRFFATDLYPAAFLQMIYRLIIVLVISLFLSVLVPVLLNLPGANSITDNLKGLPAPPNGGTPLSGQTVIAGTLAFFFAVFFGQFLRWFSRVPKLLHLPGFNDPDEHLHVPISKLEGIDLWVENRLAEESIETVQAMAGAPIEKLVRRTYFSTAHIVCWVDQAVLFMHAGNGGEWMTAFRTAGIHKATDLLRNVGFGDAVAESQPPDNPIVRPPVDLKAVDEGVTHIVAATANVGDTTTPKLTKEIVFEIASAVWAEPNLPYLVNFYNAHKIKLPPLHPPPPPPEEEATPAPETTAAVPLG